MRSTTVRYRVRPLPRGPRPVAEPAKPSEEPSTLPLPKLVRLVDCVLPSGELIDAASTWRVIASFTQGGVERLIVEGRGAWQGYVLQVPAEATEAARGHRDGDALDHERDEAGARLFDGPGEES